MALFADRAAAGTELATALESWRGHDCVVYGIPRGGVVVAAAVARALDLPLSSAVVRKIGAPSHEEYALGAIADDVRVLDDRAVRAAHVTSEQLASVEDRERVELRRRDALFGSVHDDLEGIIAIVVDDGIATGATATAACLSLKARGADSIILAVPVAPAEWSPDRQLVQEYVCPHRERDFWAVGQFYDDFRQTSDAEVVELLSHDPRA